MNTYHPYTIYVSKCVRIRGYFFSKKRVCEQKSLGNSGLDSHHIMSLHFRQTCAERDNDETARVSNEIRLSND